MITKSPLAPKSPLAAGTSSSVVSSSSSIEESCVVVVTGSLLLLVDRLLSSSTLSDNRNISSPVRIDFLLTLRGAVESIVDAVVVVCPNAVGYLSFPLC